MMINRNALGALSAALISVLSPRTSYADALQFGVVGSPIDLSANVSEAILPGDTVFQDSKPLFGTAPDPVQSAELLHLSSTGINASPRSQISSAFASSLAESNGNGGVGVSQVIFGSPGGSGQNVVRQMAARSQWTQTFLYNGSPTVDVKLHLQIPSLQVELWGPNRDNPSFTETAQATARLDTIIRHRDGHRDYALIVAKVSKSKALSVCSQRLGTQNGDSYLNKKGYSLCNVKAPPTNRRFNSAPDQGSYAGRGPSQLRPAS